MTDVLLLILLIGAFAVFAGNVRVCSRVFGRAHESVAHAHAAGEYGEVGVSLTDESPPAGRSATDWPGETPGEGRLPTQVYGSAAPRVQ